MANPRTISEVRVLKIALRSLIGEGRPDYEILQELNIRPAELGLWRGEIYKEELRTVRHGSIDEVFASYIVRQMWGVERLDEVIEEERLRGTTNGRGTIVTAVRARAQIVDSIIQRGQDLGAVHREPTKSLVLEGRFVGDMTMDELRVGVAKRMEKTAALLHLVKTDYTDDDQPEDLYFDEADGGDVDDGIQREKVSA